MDCINNLLECLDDELEGAKKYYKLAGEYKDSQPHAADILREMANHEVTHYENLLRVVRDMIDRGESTDTEQALYAYILECKDKCYKSVLECRSTVMKSQKEDTK